MLWNAGGGSGVFEKIRYGNLNEIVCAEIKKKIIDNVLKPGDRLDVEALSTQLGVSRTPVTNALKALAQSGYVVVYPRSGSYVRKYSAEEIEAIFDFREALEALIAKKAVGRVEKAVLRQYEAEFRRILETDDTECDEPWIEAFFLIEINFHHLLIQTCPQIIGREIQNLVDLTKRLRKLHLKHSSENDDGSDFRRQEIFLHLDLIRALLEDNAEEAEALVRQDIERTKRGILSSYSVLANETEVSETNQQQIVTSVN